MARILAIVTDLMLSSRVTEPLLAAGHEVETGAADRLDSPDGYGGFDLVVCDLDSCDPEAVVATGLPSIGFYPHLDIDTGDRARSAGIDLVVPRSRMARELPRLVERTLA